MAAITPFIPWIAQGAGLFFGGRQARSEQNRAMQRSPEELAALQGASGVAGTAANVAGDLIQQSRPMIQQPANYFSTLLSGNRAAMTQAVAPAIAQTTDIYRGAERGLDRAGVRGAARDVEMGELNRQRASQLSGLTTGVQPGAATALAGLGTNVLSHSAGLYNTAGNVYSRLLREGYENRVYGRQEGQNAGSAIGKLIADLGPVLAGVLKPKAKTPDITTSPIPELPGRTPQIPPITAPPETGKGSTGWDPGKPAGPGNYPPWFPRPGGGGTIPPITFPVPGTRR